MDKKDRKYWLLKLKPYRFRIFCSAAFFLIAALILIIGFWKTLLLVSFSAVGYLIGKLRDENLDIYSLIEAIRDLIRI